MQNFGQRSRQLIKAIQKLESLCIDTTLSSLPKFVVVGDQSHGKSSIIEAVCDITLPRSAGTCTRCPFQITTMACKEDTADWSCKITLIRKYAYNPKSSANNRYPHWEDTRAQNSVEFATISDKHSLEHILRLAQVAILNPTMSPAQVMHTNDPSLSTRVQFSPNIISLEIKGEDLPELSLFDLPGAINVHADDSEQHLVGLIESLVKNYLEDEQALILLACSADQDIENSTAFRFIRTCKAKDRCMGVLTKPDLVNRNRFPHIRCILNGETFKLGSSWFVTKHLSEEELDEATHVTYAQARKREQTFFKSEPWSTTMAMFSDRFGIHSVQEAISRRLTTHILNELPRIVARVETRLEEVSDQLDQFPEEPRSPTLTVINEVQKLANAINAHIVDHDLQDDFRSQYKTLLRGYHTQLRNARPHLDLSTPGYMKPSIALDDSEDDEQSPSLAVTPSKIRKGNQGQPIPQGRVTTNSTPRSRVKPERQASEKPPRAEFNLYQVHRDLDRVRNSEIADQVHPKVIEGFMCQSVQSWSALTEDLLDKVKDLLARMLVKTISDALASRTSTQLFGKTTEVIDEFFQGILAEEAMHINHIVACEKYKPIGYSGMKQRTGEMKFNLNRARLMERITEYYDTQEANGAKVLKIEDRKKKLKDEEWVTNTIGADEYSVEVNAMASPLAYYDIASARMLDVVASLLEFGVLHAIESGLQGALMVGLRVTDAEYCAQLLAEDPEREALRIRLLAEKEKLVQALKELEGLPRLN